MSKVTDELYRTATNEHKSKEDRREAIAALKDIPDFKPSAEQKAELIWAEILTAGPEQIKAQVAERHARMDAEYKFCANCFRKESAGASECSRCAHDEEWVLPSVIGSTSGHEGWVLRRSELIGAMDRERLTQELYLTSERMLLTVALRIFAANGWERPKQPYGNYNVANGQVFLTEDGQLKEVPKAQEQKKEQELERPFPNFWF